MLAGFFRNPPKPLLPGPIVVGGVGGSGTRLLAQILLELEVYLGPCLNDALDNLWYTLLLRRAELLPGVDAAADREIDQALRLFERAMLQGLRGRPTRAQRHLLRRALDQSLPVSRDRPRRACASLRESPTPDLSRYRAWGWKEPNTHIHLEALSRAFPGMQYVHLMRNGLDMAFSRNRVQLQRWGPRFGVPLPGDPADLPAAALRYWVDANRRAAELGRRLLGPRFLLLNFDEFCRQPQAGLERLLGFLGFDVDAGTLARLVVLPRPPDSTGRYRREDCSRFDARDIDAVRAWGFPVDLPD